MLEKTALFQPSATAIKHIVEETGAWLEAMDEAVNESIRQEEAVPEATQVVVTSLDGANLRLREIGKKRGRPQERAGAEEEGESPTHFKQAMVGSVSFTDSRHKRARHLNVWSLVMWLKCPKKDGNF